MPQVPYNPVPQIAPQDIGVRPSAPPEAFGTGVAAAVGDLGKDVSAVGNELWTRAVALQELHNETDAKNANVDFISKAGELHAQYNALQGQERVKAFPEYQKNLNELYQKTRGALGNASARRMFDGAAISTLNRSIFNAAGSAASAQREAAITASSAESDMLAKSLYSQPYDEGLWAYALSKVDGLVTNQAALSAGGASPERIADMKQKMISTLAYSRIIGLGKDQPNKAYQLEREYEAKGYLFGPQAVAARDKVRSYIETTGMETVARNVIQQSLNDDGTFKKTAAEMEAEVVKQATSLYPDDPNITTAASQKFKQNYYTHNFILTQDKNQRQQQLAEYMMKGVTDHTMLPPALLQQMRPEEVKKFDSDAFAHNKAVRTRTDDVVYQQYWGLYHNDHAKFMDTNITSIPGLSQTSMNKLLQLQRMEKSEGDPRVWRAMRQLQGSHGQVLTDLGVIGKAKDETTSNQFVGALHDAIQSYQEANGKAPDEKIISEQIFPAVTRQIAVPGRIWGTNQTPFFSAAVPDEYTQRFKGIKPGATDEEIQRTYHQQVFDQFFKGQKATKDQSRQ